MNKWVSNPNLVKHCLAVEAAMMAYADYFQVDLNEKEKWAIAGLIHDADWEKYPDQHPQVVVQWLRDNRVPDDLINAVEAHGFEFGVEPGSLMARVLRAVDELTGLIVAVALVRENKKLSEVTVDSVMKKWHARAFAKGVNRADIERGAREIEMPLEEHVELVLEAMQNISDGLGL